MIYMFAFQQKFLLRIEPYIFSNFVDVVTGVIFVYS